MNEENLNIRLNEALEACEKLKKQNAYLRSLLKNDTKHVHETLKTDSFETYRLTQNSAVEEKIKLFRNLFRGREDVYPVLWENRQNGKIGYSPACANEWKDNICYKPKIKCSNCENKAYNPVTDNVIFDHLSGKHTVGIYPILQDETCSFLAIDFDKKDWQKDVKAVLSICIKMEIPAYLERSRSGNGGHIWIFFESNIPASEARKLGSLIISETMQNRYEIGLDSYDRFFPNQDTLPKGGFGNLIALPLQKKARGNGNSVFLNANFEEFSDQWHFLSSIQKITQEEVKSKINNFSSDDEIKLNLPEKKPWENKSVNTEEFVASEQLPTSVEIVLANLVFIPKKDMPSLFLNKLIRLAAFQNPEYYKAQAMRLPIYDKPKFISCFEDFKDYIGLPRGCFSDTTKLFDKYKVSTTTKDDRSSGQNIDVSFEGELSKKQKKAVNALFEYDIGTLSLPTGFGKTVLACYAIGKRKVNTLILVHRTQLLDQWKERISAFLSIDINEIGQIGGGKQKVTNFIDIAILQSLNKKGEVKELVKNYGMVIVDECHHTSAFSFEKVLKTIKAKYIIGLTATPVRKDGHHPIIFMQCGEIRYQIKTKDYLQEQAIHHKTLIRTTDFQITNSLNEVTIQDINKQLIQDDKRNELIFDDILKALDNKRSPLVLTERTEHLDFFENRLNGFAKNILVFRGRMGKKQRENLLKKLESIPDDGERIILATGRYIGEGFDDARLDTLFLTMPIAWKGTLQQYVGRLHRRHLNKKDAIVYDYVDEKVPVLKRMFAKRSKGYKNLGYQITEDLFI